MLEAVIPKRIHEGWSWRVSSLSGNGIEVLAAGEESFARVSVGASEEEWEGKLLEAGLWGGDRSAAIDEDTWLRAVGVGEPVVATDDYLRPWVAGALERVSVAWLVKLRGDEVWIGPRVTCGDGIYEDLVYRLRARRAERSMVAGWSYPPAVAVGWNERSLQMAGNWWREALRGGKGADALHCFDGRSDSMTRHELGKPALGGGGKVGVVTRVMHEGFGFGRHHVLAEYCLPPLQDGWKRKRTNGFAYGCGPNLDLARKKAMYEAAERFSCFFDVAEDCGGARANEILIGAQEEGEALSSVGCAAGESFARAVASATAEVVERFVVRKWWHEQRRCPGEKYGDFHVLHLGFELGYVVAVAVCPDEEEGGPLLGAGCARSWEAAAERAADELAQVRYWRRYWKDQRPSGYRNLQKFMEICPEAEVKRGAEGRPEIEVFAMTRKRVGIPVARVLARGLEMPRAGVIPCPL